MITRTTGCSSTDLTTPDRQCADRGYANTLLIPSGVICYSRTNAGSEAVYICDDGFHQDGAATRVCRGDGEWQYTSVLTRSRKTRWYIIFCVCSCPKHLYKFKVHSNWELLELLGLSNLYAYFCTHYTPCREKIIPHSVKMLCNQLWIIPQQKHAVVIAICALAFI